MNQQEELARDDLIASLWATDLHETQFHTPEGGCGIRQSTAMEAAERAADEVLGIFDHLAGLLGYSRPRVVETEGVGALEALWALPVGSIVECGSGMLWRKTGTGMYGWYGTGIAHGCQPDVFLDDKPLTILHAPGGAAMTVCKYCGRPIIHSAGLEWRHTARNTIWCRPSAWRNSTLATPKEQL